MMRWSAGGDGGFAAGGTVLVAFAVAGIAAAASAYVLGVPMGAAG